MRPFSDIDEMERFMDEVLTGPFRVMWRRLPSEMAWAPPIDVYEREDSFIVRTELPGVRKEDVDISVTGDTLTIKGERKAPMDVKEEQYHRSEAFYGSFTRSITLPSMLDAEKIEATYENGILEIKIPKAKQAMPKKIEIKST